MSAWRTLVVALAVAILALAHGPASALGAVPGTLQAAQTGATPDPGAALYRGGDLPGAVEAWRAAFDAATSEAERARVAYNLGNAAYRRGAPLEAVGWYLASLERAPRSREARANLALARAEAGLPPTDTGGLTAALGRAVGAFTAAEAGWLAALGVLVLALALAYEAVLGGGRGRLAVLLGAALALFAFGPLLQRALRPSGERALVAAGDGLDARSEPRPESKRMTKLAAGDVVSVVDRYLDWVRVRAAEGEFWVPGDGLFLLR